MLDLGSNPIVVFGPSETNYYDLVYYEWGNPVDVLLDCVILSISSDGTIFHPVFYWGDSTPDNNSNVPLPPSTEDDEFLIDSTLLYDTPPYQTGILVDVDNAPLGTPPLGSYQYLRIEAPLSCPNDQNDGVDIDAIEVIEVPR